MSGRPPVSALHRELAHDVRNSAGAIRAAVELLQRRYQPEGRELRLFEVIFTEIERLRQLTEAPK